MATTRIRLTIFLIGVVAVGLVETLARLAAVSDPTAALGVLCGVRGIEIGVILLAVRWHEGSWAPVGLTPALIPAGLTQGLFWSAGFGAVAAMGLAAGFAAGVDPLKWVMMPLPDGRAGLLAFYLAGGIIGPAAEELFFRGVVFGFFRRWGFWPAMMISTAFFAGAHFPDAGLVQWVGGGVFAVVYEKSRSLMAPLTVHILGNLALFTLSALAGPG